MLSRLETPDDLVDACVKAMAAAHDTEAQFLQTISEVLVDVEDDDTFGSPGGNAKAKAIVRQMRVIAILSIVLENISSHMVGHPILDGFFEHLSPAITSKNAVVREHGVICLSKFCLLSEQEKVNDQFRPLLMTIASSADERAEVRAQAAMALCDLALIHGDMLNSTEDDENESSTSFKDLLIEMLGHSKPLIVAIAAEISAKLHLAGRFHDPILVGWLVAVFFDSSMLESDESDDNNNAKEIGSAVRLQQLLSMFFPAYSMSSLDANDAIMASVGPLLEIVNFKMEGMKQKKALEQWPISKMVEYICYIVDMADKTKKSEDKAEVDEEPENDLMEPTETDSLAGEDAKEKDDKNIIEASSILLASIDIAEYLAESSSRIPAFYTRAVAKILGSASIDVSAEDKALLKRLKTQVTEAEYSIDDGPSLTAIRKLSKVLENVDDEEEEADTSEGEEAEEIAEKMEKVSLVDREKENPRLSTGTVGSQLSSKSRGRESTSSRVSLGSLN
jgi:condensin complex subunit 3